MGFFDFLWGKDKKRQATDSSAASAPVIFSDGDSDSSESDGGADADGGGDASCGGGGDGGGV